MTKILTSYFHQLAIGCRGTLNMSYKFEIEVYTSIRFIKTCEKVITLYTLGLVSTVILRRCKFLLTLSVRISNVT